MRILDKLINWLIVILVFLLPLFFLPITSEFYIFNKQTLLIFVSGFLLILWLVKMVVSQTLTFRKSALDLPIILFALAFITVSLMSVPNKVIALTAPTGVGTILALTLIYFVITNNLESSSIRQALSAFIISITLLGLVAIYQFLGIGEALTSIPWLKNRLFTPTGGSLILVSILIVGLALSVSFFLRHFNRKSWLASIFTGGASIIIAVGLILTIYQLLPGKPTSLVFLSYQDSWAIAIESFKQSPFWGVGPGNYLSAFNQFRPVGFNRNSYWDIRFGNASSFPLELLTIGGVVVLLAYLFLLLRTAWLGFNIYQKEKEHFPLLIGLAAVIILPWFISSNLLLLSFTFIFLAIAACSTDKEQMTKISARTFSWVVLGIGLLLIIPSFYLWGRVYAADIAFRDSLNALEKNQGVQVYNSQIRAIALNPYNLNYRLAYSQTNFALANSLASQPELSDQDRNNITQLIQQAIREAKVATVLNPTDAVYWENLAQIYRNLINFAQGADQWTIAAYQQAILTDPINPRLRLNLGGLFYGIKDYDSATLQFQYAINLKPDFANGYYNLASAYREQEKYQLAYNAMQVVLNLIPIDSPDYQKAKNEADELAKKLPAKEEVSQPEAKEKEEQPALTEPSPLPSPVIQPPIELPEEVAPDINPAPEATQ